MNHGTNIKSTIQHSFYRRFLHIVVYKSGPCHETVMVEVVRVSVISLKKDVYSHPNVAHC